MCLLAVLFRVRPDAPLVVAANRDELLARPAVATTVLQADGPRILGGRDLLAGGTWLAVNEHGVFAGLTNRPTLSRDPSKRSRGELPLALTQHTSAREALLHFQAHFRPCDFSPAWLFVGDRNTLHVVDMTGASGGGDAAVIESLAPGMVHVLENRAFGVRSAKVQRVTAALDRLNSVRDDVLVPALVDVLRDHVVPEANDPSGVEGFLRPKETEAACVHAGAYGTRSACIIMVPWHERPRVWSSDGAPCTSDVVDRSSLWRAD